ncbi:MAG: class I SAM-dependent methyltransferase [Jatrophihabitans sp.]
MTLLPRELHDTDRPSSTAQWTTLGRALELGRDPADRIVTDVFAPTFLSATSRRLFAPLRVAGPVMRLAERSTLAGLAASGLCRHRFIDAHLLVALPDVEQVVILGAGYDSRAYRFARAIDRRPVFEVDLAPLSRRKRQVVDDHPELFDRGRMTSIEIDFRTQSLEGQLAGSGFRPSVPTFVVWEGVSMYLTRAAIIDTLGALAGLCGQGSVLAMDYWQTVLGVGPYAQLRRVGQRAMGLIGEPIGFSIASARVGELLEPSGFEVVDLATADTMTTRYATAGRRCDDGMYVVAARLR